jgi:hypothetical protein
MEAVNAITKTTILESNYTDITGLLNLWYVVTLPSKSLVAKLLETRMAFTTDVGNGVIFCPPLIAPHSISSFSVHITRTSKTVTANIVDKWIRVLWPNIAKVSVSDTPIFCLWWFIVIKQKSTDLPTISEFYKVGDGEMRVRKPDDCKICHSHTHTSGICLL